MSSEKTLLEVTSLIADCPHSTPEWTSAGVVVLRNQHIKAGRLHLNAPSYTDEKHYLQRVRRAKPTYKDIVLTREAPIGQLCQVPKGLKCCLGQRQVLIRADTEKIDPDFLFFSLRAPFMQRQMLLIEGEGTTVSNLRIPYIENLKLTVPSPATQKNVVKLLNAIEGEMETLQRQNTALESIAQTLFRSWFVDFDPVHAKFAGKEPEAMSAELAALFPSEFENSELGLIPKGWSVAAFGDCLTHTIGGDWGKDVPDEKHIKAVRIIRGTDMPDLLRSDSKTVPARFVQASKLGQRKLSPYDLVVEVSGGSRDQSTGRALMVTKSMLSELGGVAVPASFCRLFRPVSPELGVILGQRLAWHYKEGNMWGYQVQSTGIANFQTTYFLTNDKMALPPEPLQAKFMEIVGPMLQSSCNPVIRALEQLRDHLLPRLISGKLSLEAAEATVEAITSELISEPV